MKSSRAYLIGAIFIVTIQLSACSDGPDCAVDDIYASVSTVTLGDEQHSLYVKTAGFQDKQSFYILFDSKTTFDVCGSPSRKETAISHIDLEQGIPTKLVISGNELEIKYVTAANGDKIDLTNIEVVINNKRP